MRWRTLQRAVDGLQGAASFAAVASRRGSSRETSNVELTFGEARERALEVLRLSLMLVDPDGYAQRMKEPPVLNRWATAPAMPVPVAQHLALPLEGDHARAIEENLERLGRELRLVKRRRTAWRWALVALWGAMAHALAAKRPAGIRAEAGPRKLPRIFRAAGGERPELPQAKRSMELLNTCGRSASRGEWPGGRWT